MNINFKDKKTLTLFGIVGTLALCTIILLAYLFLTPTKTINIIDFKDKTYNEVVKWSEENKVVILYTYEFSETIEKDKVVSQSIKANTKLGKKDKLSIAISKGPDATVKVTLPDFTGKNIEYINAFITENKLLDATIDYVPDLKIPLGGFIKLNVIEKEVTRGTMLIFTVSKGPEGSVDVLVPDFSDYTKTKVEQWAKLNTIHVTFKEIYSETIAKNKVISQDPAKDTVIQTNAKITVTISSGKVVKAKDLTGMSKTEADAWIKENKLKVTYYERYKNKNEGKIVHNSPNSGNISEGSTVTAFISLGKPTVADYTAKKLTAFDTWLNGINGMIEDGDAKLTKTVTQVFSNTIEKGVIISQSIKSGRVDLGTNIELQVSKGREIKGSNFANKPVSEIEAWISTNKLKANRSDKYSDSVALGNVISNSSNDGVNIEEGTTINYSVSLGAYSIPKFSGTFDQAQSTINDANNKGAGVTLTNGGSVYHDTIAKGMLIPDKQAVSGKTVTVYVSSGKAPVKVTVPNYVGKTAPCAAGETCIDSKLKITVVMESAYNENIPAGQVITQSVAAGTSVDENTAVKLTVSRGKERTATISYGILNGSSVDEAMSKINAFIKNAGFTNVSISNACSDRPAGNIIIEDSSPAGEYRLSEKINIVISKGTPC